MIRPLLARRAGLFIYGDRMRGDRTKSNREETSQQLHYPPIGTFVKSVRNNFHIQFSDNHAPDVEQRLQSYIVQPW